MGMIRMVMLDRLTVADLLALRQGGFFEGAEVRLPVAVAPVLPVTIPVQEVVRSEPVPVVPAPAAPPVPAPAPVPAAAPAITPEQQALLDAARAELAEYRTEKAPPAPVETRSAGASGIDSTPAPIVAPEPPAAIAGGLPPVARLAACTKLRDVLQLLLDGGMPAADLAGYLESMKAEVPLLQRISNITDRVTRTLEVMRAGA